MSFTGIGVARRSRCIHNRFRRSGLSLVGAIVLAVIAIAIGAGATYVVAVRNPMRDADAEARDRLLHMTGMDQPVTNKLADGFTDADNDHVADCPADASRQI